MFGKNGWMIYRSSWPSLANNPQFFYEFQLDDKNIVKNVFWSHASQQGDYAGTELLIKFYWDTQFGGWEKKTTHVLDY